MQKKVSEDWLTPLSERELIPEGCVAAFVVGSAARGWTNSRSDFDIYVVTTSEWHTGSSSLLPMPLNPPRVTSEMFYERGRRWEVTYWLDSQIDQMLAKVSWEEYGRELSGEVLSPREEIALARLANSLPILGEEWLVNNRKRLAESAFRSFVMVRSLGMADDAVEDALGQMESGNLESATLSARRALGHAVDALLECKGEYGSHMPKWRPNRFRIVAPDFLPFEKYWALETMLGYDPADPRPWITEILTVCQDISIRVETT